METPERREAANRVMLRDRPKRVYEIPILCPAKLAGRDFVFACSSCQHDGWILDSFEQSRTSRAGCSAP